MKRNRVDPTQLLLGGILVVLLAIFGYIIVLTRDTATTKAETQGLARDVKELKEQMHDAAEYIGPLWLAHNNQVKP